MNNCQKKRTFVSRTERFFLNERDSSRLVEQEGSRDRNKIETKQRHWIRLARGETTPPSIDFQTRLEISFDRHRFRFPRIQITKAELPVVCAARSRTLGHFVELKMFLVFFPPPPLYFFFSFFLDTGKFADRKTRDCCCAARNGGWKKNCIEGKG